MFTLIFRVLGLSIIVLISIAIKTTKNWYVEKAKKQQVEKERSEAELKNLKDKLNPHFLFNTLSNIYVLAGTDSDKAQYAIHSLSQLLRYVLYDNDSELASIQDEMDFTRSYIELMSLRVDSETTSVRSSLPKEVPPQGQIAPLMFVTLIENAFKHGVSGSEKSFIDINIHIDDGRVCCTIANSLFPKSEDDKSGSGIGLDNLYRRPELLYGGEYDMRVTQDAGQYVTYLEIPIR